MNINSLGKNLALYLFVYDNTNSILCHIVDFTNLAMVMFVELSFWNSAHSLYIFNITNLVYLNIGGRKATPMFSKRYRGCLSSFLLYRSFWYFHVWGPHPAVFTGYSGITPVGAWGTDGILEFEPQLTAWKANTLPTVLLFQPFAGHLGDLYWKMVAPAKRFFRFSTINYDFFLPPLKFCLLSEHI